MDGSVPSLSPRKKIGLYANDSHPHCIKAKIDYPLHHFARDMWHVRNTLATSPSTGKLRGNVRNGFWALLYWMLMECLDLRE